MAGEQKDLGFRLRGFLYQLPGMAHSYAVGQAVLERVGFGNLVGRIPQGVSAWMWCEKALEALVDVYPNDTPQQLEFFLVGLATTDLRPIADLSPEDKTQLEEWRVEARGLSCEELCRLLAPAKWVSPAVSSRPAEIAALIASLRVQQATQAAIGPSALSARQIFPLLDLEDQVVAFKNTNPDYATGGLYPCLASGDLTVIENWLIPRLIAMLMPKAVEPKALWLTNKDVPAADGAGLILEMINHKLDEKLGQDLQALVGPGRDPALVLIRTSNSIPTRTWKRLAGICCTDAAFRALAEQARRNSVLLIVCWAATGEIEPDDTHEAGLCVIPVGDMERHVLRGQLRGCLQQLTAREAEIDQIVERWSSAVGDEIGAALQIYHATLAVFGGGF